MNEEISEKAYEFIKGNLLNFIVIITSFSYILYNEIVLEASVSFAKGTASVLIAIVCGMIIKQCIGENGFNKGYSSPLWAENHIRYRTACNEANEYVDLVDNFYAVQEIEKKRDIRRAVLQDVHLRYQKFFNKDGEFIEQDLSLLTRKQRRAINYCVKLKIYNLNLFSEQTLDLKRATKPEMTDKKQRSKTFSKNGLLQVITAVIGGYFGANLTNWNWGNFIIATLQVSVWIATGIIQLYTNYNYIVVDKVNKLSRKIELIIKFKKGCEQGLYKENPYDKLFKEKENDGQI